MILKKAYKNLFYLKLINDITLIYYCYLCLFAIIKSIICHNNNNNINDDSLQVDNLRARFDRLYSSSLRACSIKDKQNLCVIYVLSLLLDYHRYSISQTTCVLLCNYANDINSSSSDKLNRIEHNFDWYNVTSRFKVNYKDFKNVVNCMLNVYGRPFPHKSKLNIYIKQNVPLKSIFKPLYNAGLKFEAGNLLYTYLNLNPNDNEALNVFNEYVNENKNFKKFLNYDQNLYKLIYSETIDKSNLSIDEYEKSIDENEKLIDLLEIGLANLFWTLNSCFIDCENYLEKECTNSKCYISYLRTINKCQNYCYNNFKSTKHKRSADNEPNYLLYYLKSLYKAQLTAGEYTKSCSTALSLSNLDKTFSLNEHHLSCNIREDVLKFISIEDHINHVSKQIDELEYSHSIPNFENTENSRSFENCLNENVNKLSEFTCDHCYKNSPAFHKVNNYQYLIDYFMNKTSDLYATPQKENNKTQPFDIVAENRQLNGTERFLIDGFLSNDECSHLIELINDAGIFGDGYKSGKPNPLNDNEIIIGLNPVNAGEFIISNVLSAKRVDLFYTKANQITNIIMQNFCLNQQLYMSFAHLICRFESTNAKKFNRNEEYSHPIHSDNCILTSCSHLSDTGRRQVKEDSLCDCVVNASAYYYRNYSAILYLNDHDFRGGEFFFIDKKTGDQTLVKPKCGRLVAFRNNQFQNIHGVRAVQGDGRRCALAMWFTLDKNWRDKHFYNLGHLIENFK